MKKVYSDEVEVIAKKKPGVGLMYIVGSIMVIILIAIYYFKVDLPALRRLYLAIGAIYLIIFGAVIVKFFKTKNEVIVRDGDTLYFPNGSCKIWQVIAVEVRRRRARYILYDWGRVRITTDSKVYTFRFIEDVEVVRARLLSLMDDYKRPE